MSGPFTERWYRLLLRAFPADHRAEYGAEMLGTLADGASRRVPSARETAGLLTAGFATRARAAAGRPTPWWVDGVHLGMLTLALANLAFTIADRASVLWLALATALVVTLLRGRAVAALPLALAIAFSTGRAMLFGVDAIGLPFLGPVYVDWASLAPYGLQALGAVLLAGRRWRGNLRVRPWWWLTVPGMALVILYSPLYLWEWGNVWLPARTGLEGTLLLAGVWATAVTRSPRWILAAAIYVLPGVVSGLYNPPQTAEDTGYWLALPALLLVMAMTTWRPAKA